MKKITAIMFIGSLPSATILVKACLLPIFFALLSMGCDFNDNSSNTINSKNDHSCGAQCDQGRFKIFSGQAVHLEIEPTGEISQVFYNIDPSSLGKQPIMLNKIAHIRGQAIGAQFMPIKPDRTKSHDRLDAFSDIIAIPSVNRISFLSPRVPTSKSRLQKDAGFEMDLISGLAYTLILNPSGVRSRAPVHINAGIISDGNDFHFVIEENPSKLTGRAVFDNDTKTESKFPHLRARLMLGSRLISSVGGLDSSGQFSLEISRPLFKDEETQPVNLIIEPLDFETALPRVKHPLDIAMLNSDMDVKEINLGSLKKTFSVNIEVHGSDDSLIGNANLYLRAPIGAGIALMKKQVDKSGSTRFSHVYEGRYDIAVIPPVDSQFAMRVIKNVDFDSQENIQISIDLQKREGLTAEVLGPLGQKISGAQIQFSRIGAIGYSATEDIFDDNLFKLTATTNDDGKICHRKFGFNTSDKSECSALLLDEGRYLAHIIPPAGTELAHQWITFDFPEKNQLAIRLDQPEIMIGQILKPDGKTPSSRAFVTIYLAETDMHNQPKMIGNAITDDKGFFKAFVSAP